MYNHGHEILPKLRNAARNSQTFWDNSDNTPNEGYRGYCFKDGAFTQNVTMDEMIEICAQYTDQWKTEDGKPISKEDAILQMKQFFPQLKRWANL
jgi:hypothetical protein